METIIRVADKRDLKGSQRLFRRIISTHYRPFLGEDGVNTFIWEGEADRYIEEHFSDVTAMIMNEVVIGVAVIKQAKLERLMIEPSFHRMGFGSKLLVDCEQKMFREQSQLETVMFAENHKANLFFKKHGWCASNRFEDEVTGQPKVRYTKEK